MRDYRDLVAKLRHMSDCEFDDRPWETVKEAADAIEELLTVLCNWCGVCPKDKRNPNDCEIIESCMPEPPKETTDG